MGICFSKKSNSPPLAPLTPLTPLTPLRQQEPMNKVKKSDILTFALVGSNQIARHRLLIDLSNCAAGRTGETRVITLKPSFADSPSFVTGLPGSYFDLFPAELLQLVFSNYQTNDPETIFEQFAKFSLVSKHFYRLANSPSVWSRLWEIYFPHFDPLQLDGDLRRAFRMLLRTDHLHLPGVRPPLSLMLTSGLGSTPDALSTLATLSLADGLITQISAADVQEQGKAWEHFKMSLLTGFTAGAKLLCILITESPDADLARARETAIQFAHRVGYYDRNLTCLGYQTPSRSVPPSEPTLLDYLGKVAVPPRNIDAPVKMTVIRCLRAEWRPVVPGAAEGTGEQRLCCRVRVTAGTARVGMTGMRIMPAHYQHTISTCQPHYQPHYQHTISTLSAQYQHTISHTISHNISHNTSILRGVDSGPYFNPTGLEAPPLTITQITSAQCAAEGGSDARRCGWGPVSTLPMGSFGTVELTRVVPAQVAAACRWLVPAGDVDDADRMLGGSAEVPNPLWTHSVIFESPVVKPPLRSFLAQVIVMLPPPGGAAFAPGLVLRACMHTGSSRVKITRILCSIDKRTGREVAKDPDSLTVSMAGMVTFEVLDPLVAFPFSECGPLGRINFLPGGESTVEGLLSVIAVGIVKSLGE
ncbi:hypothetical protein PAPYR_13541 [Paratrimastix pyriformis]|uniref:GTP-eEF1A C-terminal domain-containing protein n=1 Tax=Paratrimastix pyriformis TaxID=342808 RepID=A0ABQ8UFR9_9EUKA|nr:hypothetical protein PAPYR_13541 [Paratrimastix pyriformis]